MTPKVVGQVEALVDMTIAELRETYAEVFGEDTRSRHEDFIRRLKNHAQRIRSAGRIHGRLAVVW
jgi:hypothetical protein